MVTNLFADRCGRHSDAGGNHFFCARSFCDRDGGNNVFGLLPSGSCNFTAQLACKFTTQRTCFAGTDTDAATLLRLLQPESYRLYLSSQGWMICAQNRQVGELAATLDWY